MTTNHMLWDNEEEDDPLTPHNSYTYDTNQEQEYAFCKGYLMLRSYLRKQTKKRKLPLEEPSIFTPFS